MNFLIYAVVNILIKPLFSSDPSPNLLELLTIWCVASVIAYLLESEGRRRWLRRIIAFVIAITVITFFRN